MSDNDELHWPDPEWQTVGRVVPIGEHEALAAERDRLREALIATGRHLGAGLSEEVSSDFLTLIPEEARLVKTERDRLLEALTQIANSLPSYGDGIDILEIASNALAQEEGR